MTVITPPHSKGVACGPTPRKVALCHEAEFGPHRTCWIVPSALRTNTTTACVTPGEFVD